MYERSGRIAKRLEPPLLIAAVLTVPGDLRVRVWRPSKSPCRARNRASALRTTVAVVMAVLLLTRRIGEILRVRTNTVDAPHRALVRSRSRLEAAV